MKKLLEKLANVKAEMRGILDVAQSEGRSLNEEEEKRFEALEGEARMIEYQLRSHSIPPVLGDTQSHAKRFAETIANSIDKGVSVNASLRSILDEPTVHESSVPVLYQELQKPLESGLILTRVGGSILYGLSGEPLWPFVSGVEASVVGENEEVGDSTLSFSSIKSTPKRISISIPVSRRAIHQSNLNLYSLVMESMGVGVSRKLNKILCDTVAHGDYNGPFVDSTMASNTTITRAGADFSYDDALELEHSVLNVMTDSVYDPVYIMNYKMAQKLRSTPVEKGQTAKMLTMHREGNVHYGVMHNGRRVEFCNYVADNQVQFGDFKYLGLPQYGDFNIVVDPYTGAKKNIVIFTLNTDMDMVKIRKEAFAISKS